MINDKQIAIEQIASQSLLDELNAKKTEILEKVAFVGKRRYYVEGLTERDYSLENTTPYKLELLGNVIEEHSWGLLLSKTAELLLNVFPQFIDSMLNFQCNWSKAMMFTLESKTNYKILREGLYINCNHTALHSYWFLQDILDFFEIDKSTVRLLIHRPSSAEPKTVKEFIERSFKIGFSEYIGINYQKPYEYSKKVIKI